MKNVKKNNFGTFSRAAAELKKHGYKVTTSFGKNYENEIQLIGINAKKKWVSIRVREGWSQYSLLVRSLNGGYKKRHDTRFDSLKSIIDHTEEVLTKEPEPVKPNWDAEKLVEPYRFTDDDFLVKEFKMHDSCGPRVRGVFMLRSVHVVKVCKIGDDCIITSAEEPDSKPWFLMECFGDPGNFMIIADGDFSFYLVRKTTPKMIDGKPTDRYKINMNPVIRSYDHYDLRKMDRICKRMVTEAVKRYVRDHSW